MSNKHIYIALRSACALVLLSSCQLPAAPPPAAAPSLNASAQIPVSITDSANTFDTPGPYITPTTTYSASGHLTDECRLGLASNLRPSYLPNWTFVLNAPEVTTTSPSLSGCLIFWTASAALTRIKTLRREFSTAPQGSFQDTVEAIQESILANPTINPGLTENRLLFATVLVPCTIVGDVGDYKVAGQVQGPPWDNRRIELYGDGYIRCDLDILAASQAAEREICLSGNSCANSLGITTTKYYSETAIYFRGIVSEPVFSTSNNLLTDTSGFESPLAYYRPKDGQEQNSSTEDSIGFFASRFGVRVRAPISVTSQNNAEINAVRVITSPAFTLGSQRTEPGQLSDNSPCVFTNSLYLDNELPVSYTKLLYEREESLVWHANPLEFESIHLGESRGPYGPGLRNWLHPLGWEPQPRYWLLECPKPPSDQRLVQFKLDGATLFIGYAPEPTTLRLIGSFEQLVIDPGGGAPNNAT